MQSYFRRILSLFFFLLVWAYVWAQPANYKMEIIGTRDGLLSSKIFALFQAQNRLLWIGTEFGVSAYDGYGFINYQYTSANETIGRVLCITEDNEKGIWLGGDKGLFYLWKGKLQKINLQGNTSIAVEALLTDVAGNIWVGDLNALYKITTTEIRKISQQTFTNIQLLPFADFNKRVFSIARDHQQNIYLGSFDAVFKIAAGEKNYEVIWKNNDPTHPVRSVAATSPDSIYWNCLEGHPFNMIKGKINSTYTNDFIGRTVFTYNNAAFALTTSGVASIKERVQPLVSFTSNTNNAVTALMDAEENIWIGTWEGLLKFRKTSFQQYILSHNTHKEVFSMLERKNGELLFGSNRGLIFLKQEDNIDRNPAIPPLFTLAEVMCMVEDVSGTIWAGSGYQGISHYKNKAISNWRNTGFLKDNNCEALFTTADGKLFACTENGVTVIDPLAQIPMQAHYPFQKKYTRPPELFGCFNTANSGYWFYGSQGLYSLSNGLLLDDSIINMPVKNLYITKIVADKKGNIWVATLGKGLLQCRYKEGKLILQKQYDSKNGAPSDIALSVLIDKNDDVWWGDYMSISLLKNSDKNEQVSSFSESDGLLSSYYQTLKLEQQKNGTVWGLTSMGMFSFNPDSIIRNNQAPSLMINSININGADSNYALSLDPSLSHNNNSLHFQFTAVCLTNPSGIRYSYRLKELDSNWTFGNSRNANFNFLQPGKYTFEIKACNNNNVWTENPLVYSFSILPPFWQTWWFKLLAGLLIAGIIVFVFRKRIVAIKNKAAIKQQMAELEAKALRAQMNPHFIFNSLNAIQESIVLNDFDTSYQYLSKFSKLLRQVLNNSEKNFIPLSDEIEMNRLYLELESLRFKHNFTYEFIVDEMVDSDIVLFPSLLLQPFIENAIWHGLMHKDGDKKLSIHFSQQQQQLQCVIKDNGIGREKAAAIKKQKLGSQYFESKGTDLARQRIQLLKSSGTLTANLTMQDLKDEKGAPAGTMVFIDVPLMLIK